MANPIDIFVTESAFKQLEKTIQLIGNADKELLKISQTALDFNKNLGAVKTPTGLTNNSEINAKTLADLQKQNVAIDSLKKKYDELITKQNEVGNSKKQLTQKTSEEIVNQRILSTNANRQVTANSQLAGAYKNLSAQVSIASEKYQNIIVRGRTAEQTQKQYNQELKKAQIEFQNLQSKVLSADKAVDKWNRTGERSVGFVKNLIGAFGIASGVTLFAALVKDIFQTTKELQSMDLALKTVLGTQKDMGQTQAFLSRIAESYGGNIKTLTSSFVQFYASAKDKLAGKDIENIFESITKSAGFLGLSTERQEKAFLALNQMMSKGTIQAEELRGQLSEALPNSMGIMVKAVQALNPEMKVNEQTIAKMMKDGKLMSAEVLPEFAKQMEIAYGVANKTRVDTLAASTERMTNHWTDFVRSLNESPTGGITQFFMIFTTLADSLIQKITRINTSWKQIQVNAINNGLEEGGQTFKRTLGNLKGDDSKINAQSQINQAKKELERLRIDIKITQKELQDLVNSPFSEKVKREELETKTFELNKQKGIIKAGEDFLNPKKPQNIKLDSKGDGKKEKKASRQKSDLDFDYLKAELEREKSQIEQRKVITAEGMNNEKLSFQQRVKFREEFSKISIELIDKEFSAENQLNIKKAQEDKEKNDLALKNKDISAKKHAINIDSINRDLTAKFDKSSIDLSNKTRNLQTEDLLFFEKIEEQKQAFNKKTRDLIYTSLKEKQLLISNNDKLTTETQQRAFDEYVRLAKEELKIAEALELAKVPKDNQEQINSIVQTYLNAYEQIDKIKSPQIIKTEELKQQAEDFASSFSKNFLGNVGLGSLNIFTQLDKDGKTAFTNMLKNADNFREKFAVVFGAVGDVAKEVFSLIQQSSENNFEKEKTQLERQYEISTAFAGDSAEAKKEIDKQYQDKQKEIRNREAKANKEMALFNIGISTAQGIISALAQPIPNVPLSVLIGVIGAIQLAAVASKEIPKYFKGGVHGGGLGMINDGSGSNYVETVKTPDGKFSQYSGRNLVMDMPKGTEILTHDQWQDYQMNELLKGTGVLRAKVNFKENAAISGFSDMQVSKIVEAVRNIPTSELNFDNGKFENHVKNGHQTKISLNTRVTFTGETL